MRDVFPPEKHAIAVYPLNNWGGRSQRLKRRVSKSQPTMASAANRLAATKSIRRVRAVHISLCMALVIIWTNSQEYERRSSRKKRRIELADPYFLPYSRLRPRVQIELQLRILTLPFTVKDGDLIV